MFSRRNQNAFPEVVGVKVGETKNKAIFPNGLQEVSGIRNPAGLFFTH